MKKIILLCIIFFSSPLWSAVSIDPLLNKVTLQLQAEQWLTTQTALVNVGINAAVADKGIEKVQSSVMDKLSQIAKSGEWHIVAFDRQQDRTGLETVQITAQARLPQSELTGLRDKAKALSVPGETFTIDNVQFTPSEEEIKQANINLRNNIYQQSKNEIDALNKIYVDQKYYLHQIEFLNAGVLPMQNMVFTARAAANGETSQTPAPLSVGNKLELQARVVLAAMPEQIGQLITRTQP